MTNKNTLKHVGRYRYLDCLRDEAPTPTGLNGTTLYQVLMVGGMVALVVTVDGMQTSGKSFFEHSR